MLNLRMLKQSDFTIWMCVGILLFVSSIMILSATFSMQLRGGEDPFMYLKKHLFAVLIGLVVMAFMMYIDFDRLKFAAIPLYVLVVLMLGIVLIKGFTVLGAQRWISIGPLSMQPSELAKLVVIIILAFYLQSRIAKVVDLMSLFPVAVIVGLPFLLIFKQPDLGSSLVIIAISLGMLVWAKSSLGLLALLFTPVLSVSFHNIIFLWLIYLFILGSILYSTKQKWLDSIVIMGMNIVSGYVFPMVFGALKEYQRQRLLAFLNPNIDPKGVGYHTLQSKIAIGSGGFFGTGPFHGTQTQLQFIPQQFSDFIFSAIGEELGFLGALAVVAVFIMIILRAIKIAEEAPSIFGSLLAGGIAVMYIFHLTVNVGMTLGLLPVVGIPLPLMSYGGTSLLMNLAAIGILQSIAMRRSKLIF